MIRHADPDYKNDTITEKGRREARALAESLKGLIDDLYVSPLGRARETCKYISKALNIDPIVLDWLREIDIGLDLGYAPWNFPKIEYLLKEDFPSPHNWWKKFRVGEHDIGKYLKPSYYTIANGFDKLMEKYGYERVKSLYRFKEAKDKRIALVAHGGMILTLLSYLLHWPLPLIYVHGKIDTTGVTIISLEEIGSGYAVPRLIVFNDLSHLKL